MQNMFTRITLLAAMLTLPLVTKADDTVPIMFTVQGLYNDCKAAEGTREFLMCGAYISGVMDMMSVAGIPDKGQRRTLGQLALGLCAEPDPTFGAGVQVFKNWAQKNPKYWGWTRGAGVVLALREVWPCT